MVLTVADRSLNSATLPPLALEPAIGCDFVLRLPTTRFKGITYALILQYVAIVMCAADAITNHVKRLDPEVLFVILKLQGNIAGLVEVVQTTEGLHVWVFADQPDDFAVDGSGHVFQQQQSDDQPCIVGGAFSIGEVLVVAVFQLVPGDLIQRALS